ncbi:MAG: ATP-binding protein [Bacteroidales bacterium]
MQLRFIKNLRIIPIIIQGNDKQLHQMFLNIITNSLDVIKTTGEITINTNIFDKNCQISIKDTGHGICQDIIDKIFDPFFITKEPGKGTGLGLSIALKIVK